MDHTTNAWRVDDKKDIFTASKYHPTYLLITDGKK